MEQPAAIVTGASRGIGRAIAEDLARRGYHVVGMARNAVDDAFPGEFVAVDLTDRAALLAALDTVTRRRPILHLVNNAGIVVRAALGEVELDSLQTMIDANLVAPAICAQAVLPAMRAAGYGRIVNIGSRAGLGKVGRGGYGATKAGLVGWTRSWALELAREGITVNCVAPGPIETELFLAGYPRGSDKLRDFVAGIPAGRMGRPEEVAAACAFFLSKEAAFVTGQTLYVCGGLSVSAMP